MEKQEHGGMFGMGEPNTAFAQYFIGNSYLKPLTKPGTSVVSIANVTFDTILVLSVLGYLYRLITKNKVHI